MVVDSDIHGISVSSMFRKEIQKSENQVLKTYTEKIGD